MKKAVNSGLILLSIGALLLSGCGLRQCLHTTMGCEPDRTEREKPCQKFGGSDHRMPFQLSPERI
jgi:hypothetical protein